MKAALSCLIVIVAATSLNLHDPSNEPSSQENASAERVYIDGYQKTHTGHLLPLPEMRLIPGGEFPMGNPNTDQSHNEYHQDEALRQVSVDSYYLSRFTVTNESLCVFLNSPENTRFKRVIDLQSIDGALVPVKNRERWPARVSFNLAQAYCKWLASVTGQNFRLPTEEEWEFAARGENGAEWPWRGEPPQLTRPEGAEFLAARNWRWIDKSNSLPFSELPLAAPIGIVAHSQTPQGVYGMMGSSIGEWCSSKFNPASKRDHYPRQDPTRMRVIRGGRERKLNEREVNWLLLPLIKEAAVKLKHDARTWTRIGGGEKRDRALIRLALDLK